MFENFWNYYYWTFLVIFLFHIAMPTADIISDLILVQRLVSNGQLQWAILSSIPITFATIFHLQAWTFEEYRNQVCAFEMRMLKL